MADEVDYESDSAMAVEEENEAVRAAKPAAATGGRRVVKGRGRGSAAMDAARYPDDSGVFDKLRAGSSGGSSGREDDARVLRSVEGWILFVRGLDEEAQEEDVIDAFGEDAPVKNLHMNLDRRSGFVKGYALVEFASFEAARDALERMDGQEIVGKTIHVDWAFRKERQDEGRREGRRSRGAHR